MEKYLVEYVGTVFFLYVIIATGNPLAIGAALAVAIYVGKNISGGDYNPAVSIMMALSGKLPMADLAPYIIAQIAGALTAMELYKRFPNN